MKMALLLFEAIISDIIRSMESISGADFNPKYSLPPSYPEPSLELNQKEALLPADSAFVQACNQMFSNSGWSGNIEEMQKVATRLLGLIQKSIGDQIGRESQLSRERRKKDLKLLTGEE